MPMPGWCYLYAASLPERVRTTTRDLLGEGMMGGCVSSSRGNRKGGFVRQGVCMQPEGTIVFSVFTFCVYFCFVFEWMNEGMDVGRVTHCPTFCCFRLYCALLIRKATVSVLVKRLSWATLMLTSPFECGPDLGAAIFRFLFLRTVSSDGSFFLVIRMQRWEVPSTPMRGVKWRGLRC